MSIKTFILRIKTKRFKRCLQTINPDRLRIESEQKAIAVFKNAAKHIPAYKEILKNHKIDAGGIHDITDFKRFVPVVSKEEIFNNYKGQIEKLCLGGNIRNAGEIISSSGHSGNFSFGLTSRASKETFRDLADVMLDYTFNITGKKTLLINALPMGIKICSDYVVAADTGPRTDTVVSILKEFSLKFEQVIIAADNNFMKNTLEEAIEAGVDIKKTKIHLLLGEEILAENLRSYLADLLGEDLDNPHCAFIGSSFGIAELGLNLMFETRETICLRRRMRKNKPYESFPMIFQYFPSRVYVEEYINKGVSELVMTNLTEDAVLPLVRYNTKDRGKFIKLDTSPSVKLPAVALYGRDDFKTSAGKVVMPELVKEILFSDFNIAASITGYFRISESKGKINIDIQLKKEKEPTDLLEDDIDNALSSSSLLKIPYQLKLYSFFSFPYGLELDYERKFRYV